MAAGGIKGRVVAALERARDRWPWLDRALRTQQSYAAKNGNVQAGGVTYFAFLSFFPILALAFFVVGYVARIWPDAQDALTTGLSQVFPGLIGGSNGISLQTIQDNAGTAGLVGLVGVLYAGLGWLSALRGALLAMFDRFEDARPNFVVGKLRDLATLAVIGTVLLLGVAVASIVNGFSEQALGWLGLGASSSWVLWLVSLAFGIATSTLMFMAMFTLLARPRLPRRELWTGALLGAVGYEVLKWGSTYLIGATREQEAIAVFGIALVLVVWMYYFSRLVLYAAAWAQAGAAPAAGAEAPAESADARALRERVERSHSEPVPTVPGAEQAAHHHQPSVVTVFLGGAGLGAVGALVLRRRLRDR